MQYKYVNGKSESILYVQVSEGNIFESVPGLKDKNGKQVFRDDFCLFRGEVVQIVLNQDFFGYELRTVRKDKSGKDRTCALHKSFSVEIEVIDQPR